MDRHYQSLQHYDRELCSAGDVVSEILIAGNRRAPVKIGFWNVKTMLKPGK